MLLGGFVKNKCEDYHIYNIDALTYAGNLENLIDIEKNDNYTFIKGDIKDEVFINKIFDQCKFEHVTAFSSRIARG